MRHCVRCYVCTFVTKCHWEQTAERRSTNSGMHMHGDKISFTAIFIEIINVIDL